MTERDPRCTACRGPSGPSVCCRAPYYVQVTEDDVARLEWVSGKERLEFAVDGRLRWVKGACVFLAEDGRCTVYGARPAQCEAYEVGAEKCPCLLWSEPGHMSEPVPPELAPAPFSLLAGGDRAYEDSAEPEPELQHPADILRTQLAAYDAALDKEFEVDYHALCKKHGRRLVVESRLFVERMK